MAHSWDPQVYLRFGDERGRPFFDLMSRVGAEAPTRVVDLGCGPGNLTATLRQRWPSAEVHGVDASAKMIRDAQRLADDRLSFEVADLRSFDAAGPVDVLASNATLQWVPGHLGLLESLVGQLAPGGWLALQVPGNFEAPVHALLSDLARDPRFAAHTKDVQYPESHDADEYLTALAGMGCRVDAWETTYLHVLSGPDPVTWRLGPRGGTGWGGRCS